ncbi:hypothetical protein N806_20395 [Rhodococcus sp. P27]|nr:hypothetical protein N806_12120 [Rhodococcus sp. P27]ERB53505.1 hypothetical protein N806_20395 [Rhodococcus sp. P27]
MAEQHQARHRRRLLPAPVAHGTAVSGMPGPLLSHETRAAIRTGTQAGIKVPREFLAELLQNAPLPAWEKAEQMWGRATVDALLEAS